MNNNSPRKEVSKEVLAVRRAFRNIYEAKKLIRFNKSFDGFKIFEKHLEWTETILKWPLDKNHCLRRFDELVWDLLDIYEYSKDKNYLVDLEWIKPFVESYCAKCAAYYYDRLETYERMIERSESDLQDLQDFKKQNDMKHMEEVWKVWHDPIREKSLVYEKRKQKTDPLYKLLLEDRIMMEKSRLKHFINYKKRYEKYINDYRIEFIKLIGEKTDINV